MDRSMGDSDDCEKSVNDLRVLIISEDPLARAGLSTLLADQPGCEVVGQEASAEALASTETDIGDVVVMDMGWDLSRTLETEDDLRELSMPVVVLIPNATSASEVWASGGVIVTAHHTLERDDNLHHWTAGRQHNGRDIDRARPDHRRCRAPRQ